MKRLLGLGAALLSVALVGCGESDANAADEAAPAAAAVTPPPVDMALWEQFKADSVSLGGGDCADNFFNCPNAPNPVPVPNTVWLEEMTWMDVRDEIAAGKTTVIIPTGGFEPNGPWLVLGKHNYVLQTNCDVIARKLGNALLCAGAEAWCPRAGSSRRAGT